MFNRRSTRLRILAASLAPAMAIAGCDDPTAPLPRGGPPDELRFEFGGCFDGGVTVEARGATVTMWRRSWDWHPGTALDTGEDLRSASGAR
jgi:hypothetical protein